MYIHIYKTNKHRNRDKRKSVNVCEKGRESGDLFKAMLISKSWTETADQLSALQKTLLTFKPKHEINMTVDSRGTHTN